MGCCSNVKVFIHWILYRKGNASHRCLALSNSHRWPAVDAWLDPVEAWNNKSQTSLWRTQIEKQITLVDELLEAAPWGRKAQQTPPIPGSESKDVTSCMFSVHFLTLTASPTPKLSSDRRREEENPLLASLQISCHKLISKICNRCGRTYFFISAMSAAEKLFSCLLGGLLLGWTWPPYSVSRS